MEIYRIHLLDKQSQPNQPINAMDYTELIIRELWPGIEPEKLQRYYGLDCEGDIVPLANAKVRVYKAEVSQTDG